MKPSTKKKLKKAKYIGQQVAVGFLTGVGLAVVIGTAVAAVKK